MANLSKREQDMQRRSGGNTGASGNGKKIGIALGVVVVGLIVWAAWPEELPRTYEANFDSFELADDPYKGDPNAKVVLVGYESPHCSACQYFHNNVLSGLETEYFDTGKVVYYYIQGTIGGDFASSVAQECLYREGGNDAFWDAADMLYARSYTYEAPDWNAWLRQLAAEHELNTQALLDCYNNQETEDAVQQDLAVGKEFDMDRTPTFFAFGPEGTATRLATDELYTHLDGLLKETT